MAQATRERRRARRPKRELDDSSRPDEQRDDREQEDTGSEASGGAFSQLKDVMSESAVSVLSPVAKKLATQAAKMAIERGPELLEDTVLPKLQDAGSVLGGLGGGGDKKKKRAAGDGTGKGRRMPIQQSVDVAAPLEVVYDQFTQFEDFPKFMHRVERVEQRDDDRVVFHEKMWGVRRMWEAQIVEQRPDERIAWRTVGGTAHVGVVTFHDLSDRLTRVELTMDLDPEGVMEKLARGARFAKRAARADLKRFKAFVEMREEETGSWRGAIDDGEVVDEDEYYEDEEEEPRAREDDSYDDADEEEEYAEDDEEEEEEQSRRASTRQKSNGGRTKSKPKAKSTSSSSSSSRSRAKSTSGNGRRRSGSRAKATSGKRSK
jgi:uncharacterized membrane protein